jgi:hypothetical protein
MTIVPVAITVPILIAAAITVTTTTAIRIPTLQARQVVVQIAVGIAARVALRWPVMVAIAGR